MKLFLASLLISLSVSVSATEFSAKLERTFCSISNNTLTRTEYVNKDMSVSLTETKKVEFNGVEALIPKVLETATQTAPSADEDYVFTMTHEGQKYYLNLKDSDETLFIIRLLSKSCR
ncbi:MAG: hypothetical protein K2P81_03115 [Bacteriovoracaceae bacterium]|nr:hypothetical protein [Bacteriovoracaceae bacterium]